MTLLLWEPRALLGTLRRTDAIVLLRAAGIRSIVKAGRIRRVFRLAFARRVTLEGVGSAHATFGAG